MRAPDSSSGEPPAGDPLMAEVRVYSHTGLLRKYKIEHGEYIIGRDSSCHIVVDADAVSRHHARLSFSGFELMIEDLISSNGIFIDGVQARCAAARGTGAPRATASRIPKCASTTS